MHGYVHCTTANLYNGKELKQRMIILETSSSFKNFLKNSNEFFIKRPSIRVKQSDENKPNENAECIWEITNQRETEIKQRKTHIILECLNLGLQSTFKRLNRHLCKIILQKNKLYSKEDLKFPKQNLSSSDSSAPQVQLPLNQYINCMSRNIAVQNQTLNIQLLLYSYTATHCTLTLLLNLQVFWVKWQQKSTKY